MDVDVGLLQEILLSLQKKIRDQSFAILQIYRQLSNLSKIIADQIGDKSVDKQKQIIDFASGLLDDIQNFSNSMEGK